MKNLKLAFLFLATIGMVSCGDKKEDNEEMKLESPSTSTESMQSGETSSDEKMVELTITGNDQMQFNKKELKVKAGQTVKLTLTHTGKMGVNVMGHNWVLLKKGTDIAEFGNAAASAKDTDYIPAGTDAVITTTKMLGGGESVTIEFEAPEAGTYDFICSFPGHYALMKGKFIVE
ncbi:MAG: azurin [Gillisia sp.]